MSGARFSPIGDGQSVAKHSAGDPRTVEIDLSVRKVSAV